MNIEVCSYRVQLCQGFHQHFTLQQGGKRFEITTSLHWRRATLVRLCRCASWHVGRIARFAGMRNTPSVRKYFEFDHVWCIMRCRKNMFSSAYLAYCTFRFVIPDTKVELIKIVTEAAWTSRHKIATTNLNIASDVTHAFRENDDFQFNENATAVYAYVYCHGHFPLSISGPCIISLMHY